MAANDEGSGSDSGDFFDFPMDAESVARRAAIVADLPDVDDMPLFMKELPSDPNHPAMNDVIALSTLRYEGMTPHQVAEDLKKQGNEFFGKGTKGDLMNAVAKYDDALAQESGNAKANSIYHSNKAAALLKLHKYQAALDACLKAMELNPINIKAFYRASKAYFSQGNADMALRVGQAGLLAAEEIKGGIPAAKDLAVLVQKIDLFIKDKAERDAAAAAKKAEIDAALAERGIVVGAPLFEGADAQLDAASIEFVDKSAGDMLQFPVLLLYPETGHTDFIQVFGEIDTLGSHLAELYPPAGPPLPWDEQGLYTLDSIAVYAVPCLSTPLDDAKAKSHARKVARGIVPTQIPLSTPLLQALTTPGYVMPRIPVLHVVMAGSPFEAHWIKTAGDEL